MAAIKNNAFVLGATYGTVFATVALTVVFYAQKWRKARKKRSPLPATGAHTRRRQLGKSTLHVTVLGQGGASMGDLYTKLDDSVALRALEAAYDAGISFFDTSPWYGVGLSEMRFGLALHRLPRDQLQVQTKVGRFLVPDPAGLNGAPMGWIGGLHNRVEFDYTGAAIERQLEDILQRTGLGRIESLVIHDLEPTPHRRLEVRAGGETVELDDGLAAAERHLVELRDGGGFAALQRLRREGKIRAFGAGMNIDEGGEDPQKKRAWNRAYVDALLELGDRGDGERGIDFLLIANMHSLLNAEAKDLGILEKCEAAGVSLIVGGPFSSGILATGADPPGSSRDSQKGAPKCKAQWIGAHSSGPRTIDPALSPPPCCFNSLSCYMLPARPPSPLPSSSPPAAGTAAVAVLVVVLLVDD